MTLPTEMMKKLGIFFTKRTILTKELYSIYTNSHYRANRWTMMEEKPY
ncbi:hypothetical protein [Wolbachia endosymbiont (group A) of Alloplasta piceator]